MRRFGGAVHETRMRQMMPIGAATSLVWHLFAAIVTVTVVAVVAGMWGRLTTAAHLPQAFVVVAGLAMAPLLWRSGLTGSHGFARGLLLTFLLANL